MLDELRDIVGAAHVLTAPGDTKPYFTDWRRQYTASAECVVRPASTPEVSKVVALCAAEGRDTYLPCVAESGYRNVLFYQPADRYWRFQWTETGILVLVSVLLVGPVVYRVARRPV